MSLGASLRPPSSGNTLELAAAIAFKGLGLGTHDTEALTCQPSLGPQLRERQPSVRPSRVNFTNADLNLAAWRGSITLKLVHLTVLRAGQAGHAGKPPR